MTTKERPGHGPQDITAEHSLDELVRGFARAPSRAEERSSWLQRPSWALL